VPRRPQALGPDLTADLLGRWREPHRHHHGERHLTEVLDAIDLLAASRIDTGTDTGIDTEAVDLAAWFHDAVYAGRPDDEERSAELARERLAAAGASDLLVAEVVRLVLLTRTHDPAPGDVNGAVLCDADLSVLGAAPPRYAEYVADVRAEYAHVDDAGWRTGRAEVLRHLLGLDPLFRTAAGRDRWERAARSNLAAELRDLSR
jgi:predicted metal-dependent HD superfamily phosphohydrolase